MTASYHLTINGQAIPHAQPYEVYHDKTKSWYKAIKLHDTVWLVQRAPGGYGWGYKHLGPIQGYTRCRRCSLKRWHSLDPAPTIYKESTP